MLTKDQLDAMVTLLDWARQELHELEDSFGIEDLYGWRVYREAEDVVDSLKEVANPENQVEQIDDTENRKLYITWIGTGLCGYGGGEIFETLDEAFGALPEEDRIAWDHEKMEARTKNECNMPWSYIETVSVSLSAHYSIAAAKYLLKRYAGAANKIAGLINDYEEALEGEMESDGYVGYQTIESFIRDIRGALKGVFS